MEWNRKYWQELEWSGIEKKLAGVGMEWNRKDWQERLFPMGRDGSLAEKNFLPLREQIYS